MKICHLTSVHRYDDTRIFIKECKSLVKKGYKVHLIAPDAPDGIIEGVHVHGIKKNKGNRFTRMTLTVLKVYSKAKKIDAHLYHFHDPELIPVGLVLKMKGKKVIYDVHEDVPRDILSKEWIPKPLRKIVSALFEIFENLTARRFDGVIGATPLITERFREQGCNVVNVNNYPKLGELYNPNVDWSQKERAVVYIGGITKIRGIFEMISAINNTDLHLYLGGLFNSLEERKEAMNLEGWQRIIELGYINRDRVAEIFSKTLAGLVLFHPEPNHINSQPNKIFEYMSAGIPVIASNFPLWKDILEGNNCGLCVNPLDTEEIANAIKWMADHPEEAEKMGKNGRKAVEEKYNWEFESKKLIGFYQELIRSCVESTVL
ncbi:glycosyltransferase family 4 protein [Bacillaceae bacterium]